MKKKVEDLKPGDELPDGRGICSETVINDVKYGEGAPVVQVMTHTPDDEYRVAEFQPGTDVEVRD
jgi:hypothetical protein